MKTNDKLDLTRPGLPPGSHFRRHARVKRTKASICNRIDRTGAAEARSYGFGPAPARLKILIGTPKRLEIALSHTKQITEAISNRDKNATRSKFDLAGTVAMPENLRGQRALTEEHLDAGR